MHGNNSAVASMAFIILAAIMLASPVSGQELFVSIEPLPGVPTELYPLETAEYNVLVRNVGSTPISSLDVYLSTEGGITLLVGGSEMNSKRLTFTNIPPYGRDFRGITVKAISASSTPHRLRAEYAPSSGSTINISADVMVVQSPLVIDARLGNNALAFNEKSNVLLDLRNNSNETVSSISATLETPEGISGDANSFYISELRPGQSVQAIPFGFSSSEQPLKDAPLTLHMNYSDSRGMHSLEKTFNVEVGDRGILITGLIIAIVALVAVSAYMKLRPKKKA